MTLTVDCLYPYILPWRAKDGREGLDQACDAEAAGVGGIVLSERWESKELGIMMGALSQRTSRLQLVAGITHCGTRHPIVVAGMSATMQTLSGGRFVLGFGRGVPLEFKKMGIPVLNNRGMADYAAILRQLWAGETVNYRGPAGDYPEMALGKPCENPPPLLLAATGEKTLALAGTHFDGVVLGPLLTTQGVARCAGIARQAAETAGRDPTSLIIYAVVVAAPDTLSAAQRADILEARAVSYFMHPNSGAMKLRANDWDPAPAERILAEDLSGLEYAKGDPAVFRAQMAAFAKLLPEEWLTTGAAVGTYAQCADRLREYHQAGADRIIIHGITPAQQQPIIDLIPSDAN